MIKKFITNVVLLLFGVCFAIIAYSAEGPCAGPNALLSLIDRPTFGDSPCVVPFKKALLESGYQYVKLSHDAGYQHNLPAAELRIGLPSNNEISVNLPNYIHKNMAPHSGFTSAVFGFKHEIGYNEHWVGAVRVLLSPATGSPDFSNKELSAAIHGVVSYNFNSQFSLTGLLAVSTETQPEREGGGRFTSVSPDLVFSYSPHQKVSLYAEIFGQSKTAPDQGSGFLFDGGIIYLPIPRLSVDFEYGHRISGEIGSFEYFVGTGFAVLF